MKDIVVVGSGGFGREVAWLIERINQENKEWTFKGFIDKDTSQPNVIGDDDFVINNAEGISVAIAVGDPVLREKIYRSYKTNPKVSFPNLIDPSVLYSDRVSFGEGNIVCAGSIITVDITIGNCNIINLDCTVGHDVVIGDLVTVSPSVNISGRTVIGSGCYLGTGTQIIEGLSIGKKTVIGAGAVVNRDIPANCTAVGIPAKVIKIRQ